ncbi:cupin domain-containing protein, partial [Arthrobacter sp.]|uniref:cupin domain-containing protein n=1 Tax=Arthrobacter sp. TaxID=1667 RepID=UPI003396BA43
YRSSSVTAESWEPHVENGQPFGQVHWLRAEGEGGPLAGLWRVDAAEGADLPYRVTGSDTFHVLEGEAELETPDGNRIKLVTGGIYSFPDGFTATWRTRVPFKKFFVIG